MEEHYFIRVTSAKDRLTVLTILGDNGYTVRLAKRKEGNKTEIYIEYWR